MQYYGINKNLADCATEPWTGLLPLNPEKYRKHIDMIESKGSRYMPYSQPAHTASIEESYDWFFPEWRDFPSAAESSSKQGCITNRKPAAPIPARAISLSGAQTNC